MDFDRYTSLINKLGIFLNLYNYIDDNNEDIRRRAIDNLHSKCNLGIITPEILLNYENITVKLFNSLKLNNNELSQSYLNDIIKFISTINPFIYNEIKIENNINNINNDNNSKINNINNDNHSNIENIEIVEQFFNNSLDDSINSPIKHNPEGFNDSDNSYDLLTLPDWNKGYKFPKIMLTRLDQQILSDYNIELHTKNESMFQGCISLFSDWLINDYPPELFLQETDIYNHLISIIYTPELYSKLHFNLTIDFFTDLYTNLEKSFEAHIQYDSYTLINIPDTYSSDTTSSFYYFNYPNTNEPFGYSTSGSAYLLSQILLPFLKAENTGKKCLNLLIILFKYISEPFPTSDKKDEDSDPVKINYNRYITLLNKLSEVFNVIDPHILNITTFSSGYISQLLYYLFLLCRELSEIKIDLSNTFSSPVINRMFKIISKYSDTILSQDFSKIFPILYHNIDEINVEQIPELGSTGFEEILMNLKIDLVIQNLLKQLENIKSHKSYINILHNICI